MDDVKQKIHPLAKKRKKSIAPYFYLLPVMILFGIFVFWPFIKTVIYSFTLTDSLGKPLEFVGLDNYRRMFKDPQFWNSLKITLKFAPMTFIPSMIIGYFLATLARNKMKGSRVYEVMYSMPMAVASAPAAVIWSTLLSPNRSGIINHLLGKDIRWLIDPKYALIAVAVITVWLQIGTNFIFILTGFKNVPEELIESAKIDGAGYFRRLFQIITPIASPQLFFVMFLNITTSFQAFAQIRLLTKGGPQYSTNVLVYTIYESAIIDSRYETAYARSVILFLIILVVTLIQFSLEKRMVHYSE